MDTPSSGRRYGIIHADWINNPALGADEIAVLAVLSTYADRQGWCGIGQQTLADRLNRSRSWVNRVLGRLAELGVLKIEHLRQGNGRLAGCRYLLHGHDTVCQNRVAGAHTESPLKQQHESLSADPPPPPPPPPPPETWRPQGEDLAFVQQHRPDLIPKLATVTEKFMIHARRQRLDYNQLPSSWRLWVLNERSFSNVGNHTTPRSGFRFDGSELAHRNSAAAHTCLERLMGRGADGHPAGGY